MTDLILYAHSHNIYDKNKTFGRHKTHEMASTGTAVRHIVIEKGKTPEKIAAQIKASIKENEKLSVLVFNSHGGPAQLSVGNILVGDDFRKLKALKPLVSGHGRAAATIALHSCFFLAGFWPKDMELLIMAGKKPIIPDSQKDRTKMREYMGYLKKWSGIDPITRRDDETNLHSMEHIRSRAAAAVREAFYSKTGIGISAAKTLASTLGGPVKAGFFSQYEDKVGNFEGPWAVVRPAGTVSVQNPHVDPKFCSIKSPEKVN